MPRIAIKTIGSIPNHKLLKNLQLQDNYISNDGGDEGITIDNDGIVTASSQIDIGNMSLTTDEIDVDGDLTLDVSGDIYLDTAGDDIYFTASATKHIRIMLGTANETTIRAHDGLSFEPLRLEGTELELNAVTGDIIFTSAISNVPELAFDLDGTSGEISAQLKVDGDDLVFKQYDGNEVIRIADDRKLYFYDQGGEHISSDGTDLTIASGGHIDLAVTGEIDFNTSTCGFQAQLGTDAVNIDWGASNKYHLALNNSSTVTFGTNPTNPCNLLLKVKQLNGGSKVITWAVTSGTIYWAGGGILNTDEPTLTTTDDKTDILSFYFDGTNYFGVASLNFDTT